MRLVADYRIPGQNQYLIISKGKALTRVPDEMLKCVGFVMSKSDRGYRPEGTAFFVAMPSERYPDSWYVYLVTARHVIEGIAKKNLDRNVHLRLNKADGTIGYVQSTVSDWKFHPSGQEYVDVAVLPWFRGQDFSAKWWPVHPQNVACNDTLNTNGIGVGDEVFFAGLFINHYGRETNTPILRVGNIAAMPHEPIETHDGPMEAYLVECRSIGGLSGSPVFVQLAPIRYNPLTNVTGVIGGSRFVLLGLLRGHWNINKAIEDETEDSVSGEAVNMGIGIVTPWTKILETLDQASLRYDRQEADEEEFQSKLPVDDAMV